MNMRDDAFRDLGETRSMCCYCGTGCGVLVQHAGGRILGVRGDPDHPANHGRLCTKGATLHLSAHEGGRALRPMMRKGREHELTPTSWEQALDAAAERFADIIERHGPDSVAFYVSGQLLTEDYYVFNKLARALVGTNNIDSNSRLCMSSAVAGYKATLGADSVPACYADIDEADHLLIAGANPAWAHPIVFRRIEAARERNPALTITVVDPRRTETAGFADQHLQIAPGSDVLLFNAMLHVMLWEDLVDRDFIRDHTEGFEALRSSLAECSPGNVAQTCGVAAEEIVRAARSFGRARAALSMWCQGLNQSHHGTASNAALIHLHLATGQIGRPGAGPLSLTGQPNAMGGRETGAMASLLPGHRDPANPADRDEVARAWGVAALPDTPGLPAVQMFEALREGRLKAIWIACTNPAHSLPDQTRVREALRAAEFVVLQEAYQDTETADFADLLLPAASWGEKEGTVTNSERRVSRVRAAVSQPGEARADWRIAMDFARRLGRRLERDIGGFGFATTAEIFAEHVALTAGRDCDMSGLSHAVLERDGPQQWPYRPGAQGGVERLYTDRAFPTPSGRARFAAVGHPSRHALLPEAPGARHPLILITGRLRDQWHGMSRTGKLARLWGHTPEAAVAMSPVDIVRRGLHAGQLVRVENPRGRIVLPLVEDDALAPGQVWIPMHWGETWLPSGAANRLCASLTDPVSHQPALKAAAVSVRPADTLAWHGAWVVAASDERALAERIRSLRSVLQKLEYAALSLSGHTHPVLMLRVACEKPLPLECVSEIDEAIELVAEDVLGLDDVGRGVSKRATLVDECLVGVRLLGETAALPWLRALIVEGAPVGPLRSWLLAPLAQPPGGEALVLSGRTICSCRNVGEAEIDALVAGGADLLMLQQRLGCGTVCGSCLSELRARVARGGRETATV
ncbi:MAG TPA: molybdopterin-dependent oxidoreductase [Azoarcus taiwanensis]|nr:molybdopterin-dependent oxidoreductase [Azoarcus taiwanensis]